MDKWNKGIRQIAFTLGGEQVVISVGDKVDGITVTSIRRCDASTAEEFDVLGAVGERIGIIATILTHSAIVKYFFND